MKKLDEPYFLRPVANNNMKNAILNKKMAESHAIRLQNED